MHLSRKKYTEALSTVYYNVVQRMTQRYRKARIAHFRLYFYRRYQN